MSYNPICFRRTQEIALIINTFINNIDITKKIINIFKELEFKIAKKIYNNRYYDFLYVNVFTDFEKEELIQYNYCKNSIYWADIMSDKYDIFGDFYKIRPVTINYTIKYNREYINDPFIYPRRVSEVGTGLDRFILHTCIKTLQEGFINYYDDSDKEYNIKEKINWINQKILYIYNNSCIIYNLNYPDDICKKPFPCRYYPIIWKKQHFETFFDDITNSHKTFLDRDS